jgi:hypothetical protein
MLMHHVQIFLNWVEAGNSRLDIRWVFATLQWEWLSVAKKLIALLCIGW